MSQIISDMPRHHRRPAKLINPGLETEEDIERRYRREVFMIVFLTIMGMIWAFGKILSAIY